MYYWRNPVACDVFSLHKSILDDEVYSSSFFFELTWESKIVFFFRILLHNHSHKSSIWWFSFFFPWMQKLEFKFPLTVSCVHFICSSIGAYIAIKILKMKPLIEVAPEDRWRRIFPMSFVFCINIVLGNVSLRYIPVSFMQTIKSFTPATTGSLIPGLSKLFFFFELFIVNSVVLSYSAFLQLM